MKNIQFRPLRDYELGLLNKLIEVEGRTSPSLPPVSQEKIHVAYRFQEHRPGVEYTVALVLIQGECSLLVGCTKRNPADPQNRIRGQVEALRRALESNVTFELSKGAGWAPPE